MTVAGISASLAGDEKSPRARRLGLGYISPAMRRHRSGAEACRRLSPASRDERRAFLEQSADLLVWSRTARVYQAAAGDHVSAACLTSRSGRDHRASSAGATRGPAGRRLPSPEVAAAIMNPRQ